MSDKSPIESPFEIEEIPDKDFLYYRISLKDLDSNHVLAPVAFRNRGDGEKRSMSTDWNKYSTPEETKQRVSNFGLNPVEFGVVSFGVGDVRRIPEQIVEHSPLLDNRAHTDIKGSKGKPHKARLKFMKIFKWEIKVRKLD